MTCCYGSVWCCSQTNQKIVNGTFNKPNIEKHKEMKCFDFHFFSFTPVYRIIFTIFSLLALGTSGYFYCGCILYVFLKSSTPEQIVIALKRSGMFISPLFAILLFTNMCLVFQLISVGLLVLAVLLMYAVISFVFLHNFYDRNADLYCNTLLECYITVIRVGLLDTLGAVSRHILCQRSLNDLLKTSQVVECYVM